VEQVARISIVSSSAVCRVDLEKTRGAGIG
jgi:hypothetical protein